MTLPSLETRKEGRKDFTLFTLDVKDKPQFSETLALPLMQGKYLTEANILLCPL